MGYPPIPYYLMNKVLINNKNLIAAIVIIILIVLAPIQCLQARNFRNGKLLNAFFLSPGEGFSIMYIHSVMLTPVYETYIIDRDFSIVLTETIFQSYGAGLPATTPYDFEITKEGFRIYNINMKQPTVVYRTGAILPSHTIIVKDKEYSFLVFSEPMMPVELSYGTIPLWSFFLRR